MVMRYQKRRKKAAIEKRQLQQNSAIYRGSIGLALLSGGGNSASKSERSKMSL
jgi:hypothetical protein